MARARVSIYLRVRQPNGKQPYCPAIWETKEVRQHWCLVQRIPEHHPGRNVPSALPGEWEDHIHTAACAGFIYDHFRQVWKQRFEPVPNPKRNILACEIGQPLNFVEKTVIDVRVQRCKCFRDVSELNDPSRFGFHFTRNVYLYFGRVPVKTTTLVPLRSVGQNVGCFNAELFDNRDHPGAKGGVRGDGLGCWSCARS